MIKAVQLELKNIKPTPFTLLFAIYNAKLALNVAGCQSLDLVKQCEYLKLDKINDKAGRKKVVNDLIEKEANFSDLQNKSYIRIHIKYVLSMYHREIRRLLSSTKINEWKQHDIILSFIYHLVALAPNDKKIVGQDKVWQFTDYLRRYFADESYDGKEFLSTFTNGKGGANDNKPIKGFGLQMMKAVCSKYSLKSGPFSKVKKQCNIWATNLHQQSQGQIMKIQHEEKKQSSYQSIVAQSISAVQTGNDYNDAPKATSKFVTDVSMYVNASKPNKSNDALTGKKWYWFSDNNGFKWIPYRDNDVQKLNMAWRNNEKSALIMNGDYRVEFDRSNPSSPAGNQYSNKIQNPGGRTVICSPPKSDIHGIPVQNNPM